MKLMMVMTLAAVAVVSAGMEPVVAEDDDDGVKGVSYSRSSRVPSFSFNLVFKNSSGEIIQDTDNDPLNNSGYFPNAIDNFFYNDVNDGTSNSPQSYRFTFSGDLKTMLNGDIVKYTIISPNPFPLTDIRNGTRITLPITIRSGSIFTLEFNTSGLTKEEKAKYVNDLQFIVRQNLYLLQPTESFVRDTFGFDVGLPSSAFKSDFGFSTIPDTSIPEPNTLIGLFALGTLGAGSILKRKS